MKKIATLAAVVSTTAYAGYGGMGSYEASIDSDGGGSLTFGSIALMVLFCGGIFWFMTRFKDESTGFFWLMGGGGGSNRRQQYFQLFWIKNTPT